MCLNCGREWVYKGSGKRGTCPKCRYKVTINPTKRHYIKLDLTQLGKTLKTILDAKPKLLIFTCKGEEVIEITFND